MVVKVGKKKQKKTRRDLTSCLHSQGSQGVTRRFTLWERRKGEKGEEFPFTSFFLFNNLIKVPLKIL